MRLKDWKTKPMLFAAHPGEPGLEASEGEVGAVEVDGAGGGAVESRPSICSRVDLPPPVGPWMMAAVLDGEVDPGERVDAFPAATVRLGDASELVHGAGLLELLEDVREVEGCGGVRDVHPHAYAPIPLSVDNEANLGALAELWIGGEPAPQDFIHVSADIGIGAALVVGGRLLRGTHGFAGELGHVPVRPEGPACPCGGRGCLEQYAGEEAVLRAAGLEPGVGRIGLLAGLADDGDQRVRRALRGAGSALGIALSGAVNLLDPQTVVLGGALSRLAPWLLPSLERELGRRTADPQRPKGGSVTVSRLGSQGPLLGAAHSVVQAVLDDPVSVAGQAG